MRTVDVDNFVAARSSREEWDLDERCNDRGGHGLSLVATIVKEGNTPPIISVVDEDGTNTQMGRNNPSWASHRGAGASHATAR